MSVCKTCRSWVQTRGERGECRFNAPVVLIEGPEAGSTVWPETQEGERCGAHRAKPLEGRVLAGGQDYCLCCAHIERDMYDPPCNECYATPGSKWKAGE